MDKIDRLFDAMEHPEHYTSQEIEKMIHDPEVRETFDLLDKMKSSLQAIDTPDIDEEWNAFEYNHRQSKKSGHHWLMQFFSGNAAASIIIGIASFTAVAAIVGAGVYSFNERSEVGTEIEKTADTDFATSRSDTTGSVDAVTDMLPEIMVFDNENLETIMNRIATYYGYKVTFRNNSAKSIRLYFRWNQALPIEDVVESLNNFEQISLTISDRTINVG